MANKLIVADTGPLIAFGRIQFFNLLKKIFKPIIIPTAVFHECLSNPAQPGAKEISTAIEKKLITVHDNPSMNHHEDLLDILGVGEANAIILASQLKSGLLIDDKLGRKTAQKMHIPIIGTAGILLLAKENKLINKVTPSILELKKSGYYLSHELIIAILAKAGEGTIIEEPD